MNTVPFGSKKNCALEKKLCFRKVSAMTGEDRPSIECTLKVAEHHLVNCLKDANLCAAHDKRVTLQSKDIKLACRIRGE